MGDKMDVLVKNILNKLEKNGYESYIIGGYPRDYLLGIESHDYDICTSATPDDLKNLFDDIISSNYGSTKIRYNDSIFEITTFRKESGYSDFRRPVLVEFVKDLKTDLMRRDFTINTICMDKDGNIIDVLNAIKDLNDKIIKVVGDVETKIKEDSLRILRAIRFATVLNFKLADDLYRAIDKCGYLVKHMSYERRKEELDKIFNCENVLYGIKLLRNLHLDEYLDINLENIKPFSAIGIWCQLNNNDYKFTKMERNIIDKVNELINLDILDNYNLYKYGLSISLIAGKIKGIDENIIIKKYNELPIKSKKDIEIKDLYSNKIVEEIEKCILNNALKNNKNDILKYLDVHKIDGNN